MRVEVDAEFGCALNHIVAIDAAGERLVLHFFAHTGDLNIGDGLGGLDQCARGEEAGELIARKQRLVEMGYTRHTGVLRVAENRGARLLRPAETLQFAHADEGMLFWRGVAFVVEVVEQRRGGVEVEKFCPLLASETEAVGFRCAARSDTDFDGDGMLAQALALCPLSKQLPGLFAPEWSFAAGCGILYFLPPVASFGSCIFGVFRV